MSEETLRQKIAEKGYELLGFKNEDEKCYNFNNKNNQQVNIKFKCGHEKTVRISSICCKVLVCVPCKNLQKYNYNLETGDKTCSDCGHIHKNYDKANLSRFKCYLCSQTYKKNPDLLLYKLLTQKGYVLSKNYRYHDEHGNKTKRTGDLWLVKDEKIIVIEVDDISHTQKIPKMIHFKKDLMISFTNETRLIRVHKEDIESFVEKIEDLLNAEDKIIVYASTDKTKKFYNDLYKTFKDLKIVNAE